MTRNARPMRLRESHRWSVSGLQRRSRVRLVVHPTGRALLRSMAESMFRELRENNRAGRPTRWILPVGPTGQYDLLARAIRTAGEDCSRLHIFHMDEYVGEDGRWVPMNHPLSFRGFMERHLYGALRSSRVGFEPGQVHFPDPRRPRAIERAVARAGGVDTCYGGIGYHGHIAFNEPPVGPRGVWEGRSTRAEGARFLRSRTRVVRLNVDTIVVNSLACGGDPDAVPRRAVTLGMATLLSARRIRLYTEGGALWQRHALRAACLRRPTPAWPATYVQRHPDAEIHADRATATPLPEGLG